MKIRDLSEKGVLFVAQIRGKGGCFLTLEHEYVPFLGPRGGVGNYIHEFSSIFEIAFGDISFIVPVEGWNFALSYHSVFEPLLRNSKQNLHNASLPTDLGTYDTMLRTTGS